MVVSCSLYAGVAWLCLILLQNCGYRLLLEGIAAFSASNSLHLCGRLGGDDLGFSQ
jgi:hypothetical protein